MRTPTNLDEVVFDINLMPEKTKAIIKDYMAQKIQAAMFKVKNENEQKLLSELWQKLVNGEIDEKTSI